MNRTVRRCAITVLALSPLALTAHGATASGAGISVGKVVDVTRDQTAQNETPVAVNPTNAANLITGGNDWNYNDGCAVNSSFDGGKSWSAALPNGFLPGVTKYTNDPNVPGTGAYDAGGDPAIGFSPDGKTAYYVCQAFNFTSPFQIALLLNRSHDGGRTWQSSGLSQVGTDTGNGVTKGSNGQFVDHEFLHVDQSSTSPHRGRLYVTWAQFNGSGTHSPVHVAVSSDQGLTWVQSTVTAGTVRNNQDQRVVTGPDGTAYLTFDNGVQGGKGTALYVSTSKDGGVSWSNPVQFDSLTNPVCTFPPTCFNISGGQFRSGGSYPVPAFDAASNRLDVIYADIRGPLARLYFTSADAGRVLADTAAGVTAPTTWSPAVAIAPGPGDQFQGEISVAPGGRLDVSYYDRGYSNNSLVDLTYATSGDHGATWHTARVSTAGFDPSLWGVPSGSSFRPFIGDYNGIASTATSAQLTWTGVAAPQPYNLEIDAATVTP